MMTSNNRYLKSIGRCNFFSSTYTEIAMKNYFDAKKCFELVKDTAVENVEDDIAFRQCILVSIVFSAMAIEAFVNDYLLVIYGRKKFEKEFKYVPTKEKIKHIGEKIFNVAYDEKCLLHQKVSKLFKIRNSFVHCKSSYAYLDNANVGNSIEDDCARDLRNAYDGLFAIKLVSDFFDSNDINLNAKFNLLAIKHIELWTQKDAYKKDLCCELGIEIPSIK